MAIPKTSKTAARFKRLAQVASKGADVSDNIITGTPMPGLDRKIQRALKAIDAKQDARDRAAEGGELRAQSKKFRKEVGSKARKPDGGGMRFMV